MIVTNKLEQRGSAFWIIVLSVLLVVAFLLYYFLTENARQEEAGPVISEVVSSNSASLTDENYGSPDWIELINASDHEIDLSGYSVARVGDSGLVYTFSGGSLEAGETLVIYACDKLEGVSDGRVCTGFKLPKSGATLEIVAPSGDVVQQLVVPALQTDVSYGLTDSGEYAFYATPTPDAVNSGSTMDAISDPAGAEGTLRITECLPYAADDGYTWVELYNYGDESVQLSRFYLTDDRTKSDKCRLPDIELAPGAYVQLPFSDGTGEYVLSFGINRQEDYVGLFDSYGEQLSELTWDTGMEAGFSVGLNGSNDTVYFCVPTPGAENDDSSQKTEATVTEGITPVRINELLRDNRYSLVDQYGDRSPWVELYNPTDEPVSLSTYGLSDDQEEHFKWMLPDITLNPGEYLVVFLSGRDSTDGELHTSFKLGDADVCITLTDRKTGLVQTVPVNQESGKNVSFGVNAEDTWAYFAQPTPGTANTTASFPELAAANEATTATVRINEASAAKSVGSDQNDWAELYNAGDEAVDLSGWRLSASSDPDEGVALSGTLDAGGYMVVDSGLTISSSGETLYLFDAQGYTTDRYSTGLMRAGYTTGLSADGSTREVFASATPGAANGDSDIDGYTEEPVFSQQGGYASESFELTMTCATPGATIYYTTDGSKPTTSDNVYSGPITIGNSNCVKAVAKADGRLISDQTVATYIFDDTHSLPVICLSIDESDFSYICASENRRDKREKEGYVEYYTADGTLGVRFPAGMRIGGNGTRSYPQHTFSLHLRGGYGQSSVTYPFFDGYGVTQYSSLVLRNFGQDNDAALLRDAYCSMAVNGMNIDNAQSTFAVVYINGKYWGLYELKENQNEDYYAEKYGVDRDVVQGVRSNTYVYNGVGDNRNIKSLFALASGNTADDSVYVKYAERADEDMFIDYLIAQSFFSNSDAYNQKYIGSTDGSLKWRPVFFDLDWGLIGNNSGRDVFGMFFRSDVLYVGVPNESGTRNFVDMNLYYGFYKNALWREKFIVRFAQVMNTVLTTDKLTSLLDEMAAEMEPEMARQIARWGKPASVSGWKSEIAALRQCVIERRAEYLKEFQKAFSVSNERMEELFPNDY